MFSKTQIATVSASEQQTGTIPYKHFKHQQIVIVIAVVVSTFEHY